jgi:phospholipase D
MVAFGACVGYVYKSVSTNKNYALDFSKVEIYFSPQGGGEAAIVEKIEHANDNIFIFAYAFNSSIILKALERAQQKGIIIKTILDRSQAKQRGSLSEDLCAISRECYINRGKAKIQHNKIMIIDNKITITGSFNFTHNAEDTNLENLFIIQDPSIAEHCKKRWIEVSKNFDFSQKVTQEYFKKSLDEKEEVVGKKKKEKKQKRSSKRTFIKTIEKALKNAS